MRDELFEAYAKSADFIQAYIFPGGLLIRTSEFRALAEARGLEWRDEEAFGQDYAHTLKCWRANFDLAVEQDRLPQGFDERFIGRWGRSGGRRVGKEWVSTGRSWWARYDK